MSPSAVSATPPQAMAQGITLIADAVAAKLSSTTAPSLAALDASKLTRTRTTERPDDETLTAFAQMGSQALDTPDQFLDGKSRALPARTGPSHQSIATRGHGTPIPNSFPSSAGAEQGEGGRSPD